MISVAESSNGRKVDFASCNAGLIPASASIDFMEIAGRYFKGWHVAVSEWDRPPNETAEERTATFNIYYDRDKEFREFIRKMASYSILESKAIEWVAASDDFCNTVFSSLKYEGERKRKQDISTNLHHELLALLREEFGD